VCSIAAILLQELKKLNEKEIIMRKEYMTKAERLLTALKYKEKPDRVPIILNMSYETCAILCGEKPAAVYKDNGYIALLKKTLAMFPTWDGDDGRYNYINVPPYFWTPIEWKLPGIDLPEDSMTQVDEKEIMTHDDYQEIIDKGYYGPNKNQGTLWKRMTGEVMPAVPGAKALLENEKQFMSQFNIHEVCQLAGEFNSPFFDLSLARSFIPFTNDLFYKGDMVEKVLDRMFDELIIRVEEYFKHTIFPVIYFIEERAGTQFFPPKIFERFFLPGFRKLVEVVKSNNGIIISHVDTNWVKNLHYFRDFPDHTLAFELDSLTNIQEAREILGKKACFIGDVPGSMLTYGTPDDVKAYVRHNVETVGKDGGYIIAGGCEIPLDAKVENIMAMSEVAGESFY
jgi:hypothetical protein